MAGYVIVKKNDGTNHTLTLRQDVPANKPYINVKVGNATSYLPLTSDNTAGKGVLVKVGGKNYKVVETYTTSIQTTTSQQVNSSSTYTANTKTTSNSQSGYVLSACSLTCRFVYVSKYYVATKRSTKYTAYQKTGYYTITNYTYFDSLSLVATSNGIVGDFISDLCIVGGSITKSLYYKTSYSDYTNYSTKNTSSEILTFENVNIHTDSVASTSIYVDKPYSEQICGFNYSGTFTASLSVYGDIENEDRTNEYTIKSRESVNTHLTTNLSISNGWYTYTSKYAYFQNRSRTITVMYTSRATHTNYYISTSSSITSYETETLTSNYTTSQQTTTTQQTTSQ